MADTPETNTETAENTAPETEKVESTETDWKAEARKWESRARSNKDAAEKLAQLEDAQKSEAQRLTERAETAERKLQEAETERTRLNVIAQHSIPANLQHLVKGADEAEMTAAAKSLAELVNTPPEPQRVVVPGDQTQDLPLNGEGIENALKSALNIN